jgi:predicted ATP-grasp superfamily ATP-dependent carboligase
LSSSFKKPFIVKPDGKTSSEMVYLIKNKDEFEEKMDIYKNECVQDILIQEYIEGESLSVSLVTDGTHIECISLNSQQIIMKDFEIKFVGCISPIEHHLKDEIFKISENIIRSIPGLKGFVGIDFIIKEDDIFFIEVNSRITTPYIILKNMCNQNLTESIINLLVYGKRTKLTFKDVGEFIL